MDNTTVSRSAETSLPNLKKRSDYKFNRRFAKSFVVVKEKDETKVFISSVSSKVLAKRGL